MKVNRTFLKGYYIKPEEIEKVAADAGVTTEEATDNLSMFLEIANHGYYDGLGDASKFVIACALVGVGIGGLSVLLEKPVKKGYEKLKTKIKSRKEKKQVSEETGV